MKTQLRFLWIIAAITAFVFSGCDSLENVGIGTDAALTGLSIGNVRIPVMPLPIDELEFDDEDFNLLEAPVASAPLERIENTVNVRLNPSVSRGARVLWGLGSQDMRPFKFYDKRVNATFEDADYLYFMVTSEDGEKTQYYRFAVWVRSPVTDISEVYIGRYVTHEVPNSQGGTSIVVDIDERVMATIATANPTLDTAIANTDLGLLSVRTNQSQNAEIIVTKYDSNSKVKYGIAANSTAKPDMKESNKFNLVDQTYLYIEVTAENTVDKAYFKFRIEVGRIASIKTLTFKGDANKEFDIANTGTRAGNWASVANGNFQTADMPSTGFGVKIELDDPVSRVSWELIANRNAAAPAVFNNPEKVIFDGTKVLALKIESDNVVNGKAGATRYYKIEVTLLAAAFKTQPKSDYYYYYADTTDVNDNTAWVGNGATEGDNRINWYKYAGLWDKDNDVSTVSSSHANFTAKGPLQIVPLTVELDRPVTGTYQWYEANSWYGGYGFDADGRILYYPAGEPVAIAETGFTANTYHVNGFDEKKNVSLHNGGNQYYRLENPGRKITGASGSLGGTATVPSYTPKINYRPFIGGYTSETHYYWVEIIDGAGRKAVSKRAAIISERDPEKKHYIVNLTDDANGDLYLGTPGTEGYEKGYARNPKVFKVKRETYKIPVTISGTFNVKDYTVATVQALFFLRDGTPWIQNWTQGDIGFEDADGAQLMYYNLTNNNGTLGLVGGGKEPSAGTVDKKPKYLIVKPAGEKPTWQKPPLKDDGVTPQPNNDAQGWFCGFIELVEVRFEGPKQ